MMTSSLLIAMMLSSASALTVKNETVKAKLFEKYAYVTVFMNKKVHPESVKLAEVMTEEEETASYAANPELKPFDLHAKVDSEEQDLLAPKGGYTAEMIFQMDDQLRKAGAKYPLVVITNDPTLINSNLLAKHPLLIIKKVGKDIPYVHLNPKTTVDKRNYMHVQKLSVYNLVEYNKVLSIDMDVKIEKNPDHIFAEFDTEDGQQIWGGINDFQCDGENRNKKSKRLQGYKGRPYFLSAVVLLTPKAEIYDGMMKKAFGHAFGEQNLVQNYFQYNLHKKPKVFPSEITDYCKRSASDIVHKR